MVVSPAAPAVAIAAGAWGVCCNWAAEGEDEETGLGPVDGPAAADAAVGLRALGFLAKGANPSSFAIAASWVSFSAF